jgi:hypothetical protein
MNILNSKFESDEEDDDYVPDDGNTLSLSDFNLLLFFLDKKAKGKKNAGDSSDETEL